VQSDKLTFDNITYKDGSKLLFRINGERTKELKIINTNADKAKQKISFELGATEAALVK
jgi:hypothetical protein